jgi:hypothetical protein
MPGIKATMTIDAGPFRNGLTGAQHVANQTAMMVADHLAQIRNSAKPVQGAIAAVTRDTIQWRAAMYEVLVLFREMARGNWSRIPGSLSLLLSRLGMLRLLLNPITLLAAGLAAALYGVFKWSTSAARSMDELNRAIRGPANGFLAMADAMERAKLKAQDLRQWIAKIREEAYGDDTDHPATIEQARARLEQRITELQAAEKSATEHSKEGTPESAEELKKKAERLGELYAKRKEEAQDRVSLESQTSKGLLFGIPGILYNFVRNRFGMIGANKAKEQYENAETDYRLQANRQRPLDKAVEDAQEKVRKAQEALKRFEESAADTDETVNRIRIAHGTINKEQAVGAYAAPAVMLLDTTKKMQRDIASIKGIMQHGAKDKLAGGGISGTKL